jgi:two-component system OmpR family sensor kinase
VTLRIFKTIRGKLTLYFTLIFGITLIIFSFVLHSIFAGKIKSNFDLVISAFAASVSESIKENGVTPDILSDIRDLNNPYLSPYNGYVIVVNSSETIAIKSRQLENVNLPLNRSLIVKSLNGDKEFITDYTEPINSLWDKNGIRVLYYPAVHRGHKFSVILISPLSGQAQTLNSLKLVMFIAVPVTLILSALIGWFFSKKAYEPVSRLVAKANTISAEHLYERLAVDEVDDEISRLASTLNSMMERLELSFKTLKQFTSDASHELKTPLTIIKGEIEVALKKTRGTGEYKHILNDSLDEVNRLQNIVESLLVLSRFENRKLVLNRERTDLNEVVIDAVTKTRRLCGKKNIKVILNISETDFIIGGDRKMLLNVFLNLIDNAVKYSGSGTVINITTSVDTLGNKGFIYIRDRGMGMNEDQLENIFQRFYRIDSSRTRDENYSMGLGLSIVKATIESHNGKVTVKSKAGKGSEFTIEIPLLSELKADK